MRLLLAGLVLFGHSFSVTNSGLDPLSRLFLGKTWIGAIAVNGFFLVSGFLVAGSFHRQGPVGYAVARILRIYPALIVCILLSVFVLGPIFTTLPLESYFTDPTTWQYLQTATLERVYWYLPGVFEDQPYSAGINGSLWTLPAEIRCYLVLMIAGFLGLLSGRVIGTTAVLAVAAVTFVAPEAVPLFSASWLRPAAYFLLGVAAWLNRASIPLHPVFAAVAAGLVAGGVFTPVFAFILAPCLAYLLFFAAYGLPPIDIDRYGDVSFGVYLYAWPVQQVVAWHGQSGYLNAALAAPLVLALAALSWILVEKPALHLRAVLARRLQKPGQVKSTNEVVPAPVSPPSSQKA